MNDSPKETNPVASILNELISFRDPGVLAMFEIYEERGWFRNLFARNERWIEVQWIDDEYLQIKLLSRKTTSEIPANWQPNGEAVWRVPIKELEALADWINAEWLTIRQSDKMMLRMWND